LFHYGLSFRNFIVSNSALACTFKPGDFGVAPFGMLGFAAGYPIAPQAVAAKLHFAFHEFFNAVFGKAKLSVYGIKRGTVFPGHFYYTV
jgi:hypothetical protein